MDSVARSGAPGEPIGAGRVLEICRGALAGLDLRAKRVLVLIPDHTRHAPIGLFFRALYDVLGKSVKCLDYLVATGTHRAMEEDRLYRHIGITREEHGTVFTNVRFLAHEHDNPAALRTIGTIPASEIRSLTGGLFDQDIPVSINRAVLEYDHVIIVSPVVPHEAMGFAGGNKYFFPGVGGLDIIETFHWLAAVITNPAVNGVKDTPTRRVIDRAAKFLTVPRTCFAFAVDAHDRIACLFAGTPEDAWSRAADYSAELHVRYLDAPVRKVLGVTPDIYEELWVGGKAMYKLEPVVADGGELVIYGPQIREISFVHGEAIRRIGYHVRDYFLGQWEKFRSEPKLILAHSTNVRGVGSFEGGIERPRIRVTLATGIPEDVCRSVNLGYADPASINLDGWRRKPESGHLLVENAGQDLYRLRD
jgi:lactate racemase